VKFYTENLFQEFTPMYEVILQETIRAFAGTIIFPEKAFVFLIGDLKRGKNISNN
jgi:hypothetical protein